MTLSLQGLHHFFPHSFDKNIYEESESSIAEKKAPVFHSTSFDFMLANQFFCHSSLWNVKLCFQQKTFKIGFHFLWTIV
ncbi:MAG: hypothetical protein AUK31_05195 [Fibrobacteres bacterium CG2_30_45_31]|nr:MAG: hypothetical protein AUK31_05195 [Fibrobacteres bacterium CG2_30_45_31]